MVICRSNPVTHDPRVEKTARALQCHGMDVTVLCWDREHIHDSFAQDGSIEIHRLGIPSRYGTGLRNLFPLVRWQFRLFQWLFLNRNSYQCIHACDFDTVLPSLLLKRLFRKKVVYDIFDFYADNLRHTPQILKKIIRGIDLHVIGRADSVIVADDARLPQIAGARPRHVLTIYNIPEDIFDSLRQAETSRPQQHFRLAYVGQLIKGRSLLEVCNIVAKHPGWHFDLAGFGADEEALYDSIQSVPNIHWHGRVSYPDALTINDRADVLISIYDPAIPNHRLASPNKVFEAMMLKKPIIVAEGTGIDRLVDAQKTGLTVEYGNTAQLEQSLVELSNSPEKREEMGQRARLLYETKYNWSSMEALLVDLYRRLLDNGPE